MVDCPERNRISRDIANANREENRLHRQGSGDRFEQFKKLQVACERVKRLREEYREHVGQHGCLSTTDSQMVADATG
jgi:hypothetical protein